MKKVTIILLLSSFVAVSLYTVKIAATNYTGKRLNHFHLINIKKTRPLFKDILGVNAFEWNFLQDPNNPNDGSKIYEPKMKIIAGFGGVRHYLDWQKIEDKKNSYTFNPTANGGWNLDAIYQRCRAENINVLVCLKTCPDWLVQTYPTDQRDLENVPAPWGLDRLQPSSYRLQGEAAFQFVARYGSNKSVEKSLVSVNCIPRWTGDKVNKKEIGMGLVRYIECDNERDKWWKGEKAHQTPEEYAANLSAFFDGDMGRLGKGVGVKSADPQVKVVMAGLAMPDTDYVSRIIKWCKKQRGIKKDGSVNLCFDIINYHYYANNSKLKWYEGQSGIAPELSQAASIADKFEALGKKYDLDVWVTEAGYDINSKSPQRAPSINGQSALITQANWLLRTSFLYARHGISRLYFYELYDDNPLSQTQYGTSGLADRPAAYFVSEVKKLMGNYVYQKTLSQYPIVDLYTSGTKLIYVIYIPDESGNKIGYNLRINRSKKATCYRLNSAGPEILSKTINVVNGKIFLTVSGSPILVEPD